MEEVLIDNFPLSDAEDSSAGSLNRGRMKYLAQFRTLLETCQNLWESNHWELIGKKKER